MPDLPVRAVLLSLEELNFLFISCRHRVIVAVNIPSAVRSRSKLFYHWKMKSSRRGFSHCSVTPLFEESISTDSTPRLTVILTILNGLELKEIEKGESDQLLTLKVMVLCRQQSLAQTVKPDFVGEHKTMTIKITSW